MQQSFTNWLNYRNYSLKHIPNIKRGENIQTLKNSVHTSVCKSTEFTIFVLSPSSLWKTLSVSRNSCCMSMCWILEVTIFPFYSYLGSAPSALAFSLWSWSFDLTIHFLPGSSSIELTLLLLPAKASLPLHLIEFGVGGLLFKPLHSQVTVLFPSPFLVSSLC